MSLFFRYKTNTELMPRRRNLRQVDQFIDRLETNSSVARPVEEIFICSHGNDSGYLQIQMADILMNGRSRSTTNTTFEILEEAVRTGAVNIPSSVLLPRPVVGGSPLPAVVHIKGCKIGQTEPFVRKLKEAFGGQVAVTAPKHFHLVQVIRRVGAFTYLGYDFAVKRKTPFRNKAELVTAFQNEHFQYFDSTPVPDDVWDQRIPRDIRRRKKRFRPTVNLGTPIQRNARRQMSSIRVIGEFRHKPERFRFNVTVSGSAPGTSTAARMAVLRQALQNHPVFQATHEFPMYERYEYASLDDFIDGFTWRFAWRRRHNLLRCNAVRHRYTLILPVVEPTTNNLCLNFFPRPGNPTPEIRLLPESDPRFFLTV